METVREKVIKEAIAIALLDSNVESGLEHKLFQKYIADEATLEEIKEQLIQKYTVKRFNGGTQQMQDQLNFDPYIDQNGMIINKLGITDHTRLDQAEFVILAANICSILSDRSNQLQSQEITYEYYLNLHKSLFGSIYPWAGELRKIDIVKFEPVLHGRSVEYCTCSELEKEIHASIDKLHKIDWASLDSEQTIQMIAVQLSELWQIHPFREGNTRTTVFFIKQFLKSKSIALHAIDMYEPRRCLRNALVRSADDIRPDSRPLEKIIRKGLGADQLAELDR